MGFSFEILSEGSLVFVWNSSFSLFWTGLGFILLARSAIRSLKQNISSSDLWLDARCPMKPRCKWGR
jgi:hypothetical protein